MIANFDYFDFDRVGIPINMQNQSPLAVEPDRSLTIPFPLQFFIAKTWNCLDVALVQTLPQYTDTPPRGLNYDDRQAQPVGLIGLEKSGFIIGIPNLHCVNIAYAEQSSTNN